MTWKILKRRRLFHEMKPDISNSIVPQQHSTDANMNSGLLMALPDGILQRMLQQNVFCDLTWQRMICVCRKLRSEIASVRHFPLGGWVDSLRAYWHVHFWCIGYAKFNTMQMTALLQCIKCKPMCTFDDDRDSYYSADVNYHALIENEPIYELKVPIIQQETHQYNIHVPRALLCDGDGNVIDDACIVSPRKLNADATQLSLPCIRVPILEDTIHKTQKYAVVALSVIYVARGDEAEAHQTYLRMFALGGRTRSFNHVPLYFQGRNTMRVKLSDIFSTHMQEWNQKLLKACAACVTRCDIQTQVSSYVFKRETGMNISARRTHANNKRVLRGNELEECKQVVIRDVIRHIMCYSKCGIVADVRNYANAIQGKYSMWLDFDFAPYFNKEFHSGPSYKEVTLSLQCGINDHADVIRLRLL